MASNAFSSAFSRAVFTAMRRTYPDHLADKSFDNTGVLLEAPPNAQANLKHKVLLTIDITRAVTDEAIDKKSSVIVSYHPIIFRGLKSLTLANSQQNSLLRLAAAGISVYVPHTAVDSAPGGNADWLADIVTSEWATMAPSSQRAAASTQKITYERKPFPSGFDLRPQDVKLNALAHSRSAIVPNTSVKDAGMGRVVHFEQAQELHSILHKLASYLGEPDAFHVAVPQGQGSKPINIESIAICAGSGGSLFGQLKEEVDMFLTGEIQHHEALAAIESGTCVVCIGHSNTERGYLNAVMKERLAAVLREEWNEPFTIDVSEKDRDPFESFVRGAHGS